MWGARLTDEGSPAYVWLSAAERTLAGMKCCQLVCLLIASHGGDFHDPDVRVRRMQKVS